MGRRKTTRDIEPYRKIRKPMPRPTKVKPDEREKIRRRLSEKEQRKGSENNQ